MFDNIALASMKARAAINQVSCTLLYSPIKIRKQTALFQCNINSVAYMRILFKRDTD
jgi:hypothetical protein